MIDKSVSPLVTFALFAYNQENFIREAIESAFAQRYSPLEIILSDDCSSDKTFEIMQEMADAYVGQHVVTVRQSSTNKGLLQHVLDVVALSKGLYFVLAAGDDISKPNRCEVIVESFKMSGAWAIYSWFDKIDEASRILFKDEIKLLTWERMRCYWSDGKFMPLILGSTSAYNRRAFDLIDKNDVPRIMMEDSVMSAALHFANKTIVLLPVSLVKYRVSSASLTNHGFNMELSRSGIIDDEYKILKRAAWYRDQNYLFIRLYERSLRLGFPGNNIRTFNKKLVIQDAALYDMRSKWIDGSSFIDRLRFALENMGNSNLVWILPRLFGLKCFASIKLIMRAIR